MLDEHQEKLDELTKRLNNLLTEIGVRDEKVQKIKSKYSKE